jgi:manganese-dependent inorganic pyrophosphatase
MDAPTYVIGHRHPDTDSVCSAIGYAHLKALLGDLSVRPARAGDLNSETRYVLGRFGLPEPELVTEGTGRRLILVDHNEVAQAVDDIAHATVVEVWEHHRVGDLHVPQPIVFHCEPVGATATLVAEQYYLHGLVPPPAIAGVLLAAILSDTLVFASPTCADKDREMAGRLAAIAGVDTVAFGRDLLAARGDLAGRSAADLVQADFKEFDLAGHRVGIGQIEVADSRPIVVRRQELVDELRRVGDERHLELTLLLVTDIGAKGSHLWVADDHSGVVERAFGGPLVDGGIYLDGCMSRKKQVVPPLERALAGLVSPSIRPGGSSTSRA